MLKRIFIGLAFSCLFAFTAKGISLDIHTTAQNILHQLYRTHGDKTYVLPVIKIVKTENTGAAFRRRTNEIVLEEKAYEVCRSFGKDSLQALAFLLGHELAHAYQQVGGSNFLSSHQHKHTGHLEEQDADIFGVFVSYQAGFKNYKILPQIIERIYNAYGLIGKTLPGYPPFTDRQATCDEVLKITEELVQLFDAANYLSAAGKYFLAAKCYEYIETRYKGIEIYNNIGVNYTLQALNFTEENTEQFLHPLEIDVETRLRKQVLDLGGKGLSPQQQKLRKAYLNVAKKYFLKAGKLDRDYLAADLNLLCVLNIQEDFRAVIDYHQKSLAQNASFLKEKSRRTKAKFQLCLAIAYAGIQENDKASRIFESIVQSYPKEHLGFLAGYNWNILHGKEQPVKGVVQPACSQTKLADRVDGMRLHRPDFASAVRISGADDLWVSVIVKENSLVYFFREGGLPVFSLQRVFKPVNVSSGINSEAPENSLSTAKGFFHKCEKDRLILQFGPTDQGCKEWARYYDFNST